MAEAGLTLHPDKTRTVDMSLAGSHCDFLGYRFWSNRYFTALGLFCLPGGISFRFSFAQPPRRGRPA
jgi:hypothetical protein